MGCASSNTVSRKEMTKSEKAIKAAILIQKWYRQYTARLEARRRCTWNIFQNIEYYGEQNQLKLYNFFNSMLSEFDGKDTIQPKILHAFSPTHHPTIYDTTAEEDDELHELTNPDTIAIEPNYNGPHLSFPLTSIQVKGLIKAFKTKQQLHVKYLLMLLHEARRILKKRGNINYATTSISKQITVCGDLHGKLDDLYMIFHKNGLPSVDNPYVFNGDFVDRGPTSVEVATILFASFVVYPNEVYLNRGNHEDHIMNMRYGFIKEVMRKYKHHADKAIKMFEEIFSWLPLATVIDDKVLVVHGGISEQVNLEALDHIDRHKFLSVLRPPGPTDLHSVDSMSLELKELEEWKQVLDLLWSDPRPLPGCLPNTFRGGGCYFGPDTTRKVLDKHNLKMLIRSHECKIEGFEYMHNGRVLTIFSASNYYDIGSNKGAYVKLLGDSLQCHISQYVSTASTGLRKITFTQRISSLEASALHDLREKILALKSDLMEQFQKHDIKVTGRISMCDWCSSMEEVVEVDVPWRMLKPKMVKTDQDGMVLYKSMFEELQVQHRYSNHNSPTLTEMLYRHKDSLETIFRMFDRDNSGYISMEEFEEACSILTRHTSMQLQPQHIADIAKSLDLNGDGKIDFNEFLEAFRIVDAQGKEKNTIRRPSLNGDEISEELLSDQDEISLVSKTDSQMNLRVTRKTDSQITLNSAMGIKRLSR
ncbi:serine/threonine-protein phosphatase with EF-hands 2-like [Haliotis rubra]|uniref:serine/threonine-protein phosphatase with EF-hands 2-like n=1 Tax=Haliotis rubra TaxID=36100 RepID=UPI001EE5685E|nr:serine/threonine-protein phosphatase with EF-hands 2-like [Haliotis rubra]